ncbi:MAG: ABC transporter ATP-binding protein [Anaerolineae bacterium]|nr:ABC transporter ATP-binding protein [Anaerolineae bacterium]
MIKVEGLTRWFDGTLAVDSLTLEVREGEIFGLLGPNGAGKTTTVRMLACLIAPTSGQAIIDGYKVGEEDTEIRRRIGFLTEAPGLYDRLSAYKNLDIYARLYEVPADRRERQIRRYLEMLELWDRRHDPVATFSKGMKQKLAIARALIHEPRVLFLDEPTAGLDPEAAKLVRDFIAELRQEGRTIFLCTHNLDEADRLCDRIGVIRQHLIQVDTPENLRNHLYGRKVVMQLRALSDAHLRLVRALPFVKEAYQEGDRLVVALDNPEDENPILVRRLVEAGAEIQFVSELKHSLEEVYLTLIKEESER